MASRRFSLSHVKVFPGFVSACAFWACLVYALPCVAAGKDLNQAGGQSPIVVTARTMLADNKKKTVVYKKDVVVKKGGITLYADEVVIRLAGQDTGKGDATTDVFKGSGKVDTIEAKGNVKIVEQDKTATAGEAVYYSASDKILLKGQPRVWQGGNVLSGSSIAYNVKEDTFLVEDAKTTLYQDEKGGGLTPRAEGGQ